MYPYTHLNLNTDTYERAHANREIFLMRQMHLFAHNVCLLSAHNALGQRQQVIQIGSYLTLAIPFL